MSEKDMINETPTPGVPSPEETPQDFQQMLQQLTGQTDPQEAESLPPVREGSALLESEHSLAADSIIAAAEDSPAGMSWLDNLLAFADRSTARAETAADGAEAEGTPLFETVEAAEVPEPDHDTQEAQTGQTGDYAPLDEGEASLPAAEEAEDELSSLMEQFAPAQAADSPAEDEATEAEAPEEAAAAEDEAGIPQWAFDAILAAEEGAEEEAEADAADAQSDEDDGSEEASPSPADADEEQDTANEDTPFPAEAPQEDEAAFDGEATAEFIPAATGEESPAEGDGDGLDIESKEYETPAAEGKGDKEFRIETDYRHDFGDYDRIRPITLDKRHKTGCVGGILYFLFIVVTGVMLGCMLWLAASDVLAINKAANDVEITIPEGYTIDQVADILHENGLINYKFLFKIFADFSNAEEKIDPGVYQLKTSYDYRALVSCMSTYSGYRVVTEVTIPEGYNQFQMFELLEAEGVCTQAELWEAAENGDFDYDFILSPALGGKYRLEGFLFPDTYEFYINDDPERVLNKMLSNFNNKFDEEFRLRAEELGYSVRDIISIAAMIEKETGIDSERSTIASVIYNRLNSEDFPHLQIDATIIYATYVTGEEFSIDLDSEYNTYVIEGLPAPITNPGLASIRAALYPESTNYYFYAATTDYTTRFFSRYEDFEAFVESDEFQSSSR